MEWTKDQYNKQYEKWVPWLEDIYLRYFTRDNKASYTARENLAKTKLPTTNTPADALQDSTHSLVADQLGQDGLARPVGDIVSQEGINRVERKGKDEKGDYVPDVTGQGQGQGQGGLGQTVAGAGDKVVGGVVEGGKQAGGWFGFGKGK